MRFWKLFRPLRRIWNRITYKQTIHGVGSTLYTALQFTTPDIAFLQEELQGGHHSQWYGYIDGVVTISWGLPIKQLSKPPLSQGFPAVFPCQLCPKGVVAVREEFKQALEDLDFSIKSGLFGDPLFGDPRSKTCDEENPRAFPIVFVTARLSGLNDGKMRRIGVPELLATALRAILELQSNDAPDCRLVLPRLDLEQCGIYSINPIEEKQALHMVRIKLRVSDLQAYVSHINGISGLLCDLLILLNDNVLSERGSKLNLTRVGKHITTVSKNRSMDPDLVSSAVQHAYAKLSDGPLPAEDMHARIEREDAVKYIMDFSQSGFSCDHPRKVIHDSQCTFHLLNEKKGVFKSFKRSVKSVSQSGYRVRNISIWMWLEVAIGVLVPVVYMLLRRSKVSPEELFGTATSLVGLYVAIVSPVVLQSCYRGERLGDILANIRNVDTQEEFNARTHATQLSDVLEILRKAVVVPQFLGGRNMGYVCQLRPDGALNADKPMPFPNLELAGYALYEDEKGEMYMLDKWSNLFEVKIQIRAKSTVATGIGSSSGFGISSKIACPPFPNIYMSGSADLESSEMTLQCKAVREITSPTRRVGKGCLLVSYNTAHGENHEATISRLLPFGARMRRVESKRWRFHDSLQSWAPVKNVDILGMDIGG